MLVEKGAEKIEKEKKTGPNILNACHSEETVALSPQAG